MGFKAKRDISINVCAVMIKNGMIKQYPHVSFWLCQVTDMHNILAVRSDSNRYIVLNDLDVLCTSPRYVI